MTSFAFYNIEFVKSENSNQLMVRGEIENKSGKDCNAVAIRLVLFRKNISLVNTVIVVNGLHRNTTRSFEKVIEESDYNMLSKEITRHDIYVESAY